MKFIHYSILLLALLTGFSACQKGETKLADSARKADAESSTPANPDSTKQVEADKRNGIVRVSLTQAQYAVAGIGLGQLAPRPLSSVLKVTGVLDVPPQNQISVSVPFGGYVRQITLEPGTRVRKGQALLTLENPDYIQLQQDYLDNKAKLDYADLEFARQQELSRDNVTAVKTFQQTRANRQSLQALLAGDAQRLAILHIDPAKLNPASITRTIVVRSPASGYVTSVPINNGKFVNPADVLVEITNVDHLHARLNIFEKDLGKIRTGQSVRFGLGGDAGFPHRATIFLLGKTFAADRTVPILAEPEDYSADFIPGSYVSAQIDLTRQSLPTLPEAAVVGFGGKSYVYVLEKKEPNPVVYQFRQLEVTTGTRENGHVAVTLPNGVDTKKTPIVVGGAYSLLSKLNNSEEE